MPYKDIEKRREYQRERAKRIRKALIEEKIAAIESKEPFKLESANSLKPVLEEVINEVMRKSKMDTGAKARVICNLTQTALKLFEVSTLEERVVHLEQLLHATVPHRQA